MANTAPETCRLCPATSGSLAEANQVAIRCFVSTADPPASPVADILNKHFWFELDRDRDATAFVCPPCWRKVDAFHEFYESVLTLYQTGCRWLSPPKDEEPDVPADPFIAVTAKLEVILTDDGDDSGAAEAEPSPSPDTDAEEPATAPVAIKRLRGRARKRSGQSPVQLETDDEQHQLKSTADNDAALLSQYFTLQCDLCSEALPSLEVARTHYRLQHQCSGYLSCGCGQQFGLAAKIREHCAFHADPAQWKCARCCRIFTSRVRLATHRRLKHPTEDVVKVAEEEQKTPRDESTKSSSDSQTAEQRRRDEDELLREFMPMQCDECSATFEDFNAGRRHHQVAHGTKGYLRCCGKQFAKRCKALEHCQWHRNPRDFDCPTCSRNFATQAALQTHRIRRHPSDAPFRHQCRQCAASFQLIGQLHYHQQRQHVAAEQKRFECYHCHQRYVFLSQLRVHLRNSHLTEATHMCDVCAKCFKSKANYELHYAVEHSTEPLKQQCPECGKWMKHARSMARHALTHRAAPETCAECGHVSPNSWALSMHRRRVHRAATLKCLVCGMMLKRQDRLREHMALHAGITDLYKCAYCPRTFRSNANMYKHRLQEHAAQYAVDKVAARLAEDARNMAERAAGKAVR